MDVILCLGGNNDRLIRALELAKQYPHAKLILSTLDYKRSELHQKLLDEGLNENQFIIDYKAIDTLGNFVDTLPLVRPLKPSKVYIVTDDFHMKRARTIADIVYFGLGYELIACPCATGTPQEPKAAIDAARLQALFWKTTGIAKRDKAVLARKPVYDKYDVS